MSCSCESGVGSARSSSSVALDGSARLSSARCLAVIGPACASRHACCTAAASEQSSMSASSSTTARNFEKSAVAVKPERRSERAASSKWRSAYGVPASSGCESSACSMRRPSTEGAAAAVSPLTSSLSGSCTMCNADKPSDASASIAAEEVMLRRGLGGHSKSTALRSCSASSTLGQTMSAWYGVDRRRVVSSGSRKASVLPEPVCDEMSAFFPREIGTNAASWIGNGCSSPAASNLACNNGPTEHRPHMTAPLLPAPCWCTCCRTITARSASVSREPSDDAEPSGDACALADGVPFRGLPIESSNANAESSRACPVRPGKVTVGSIEICWYSTSPARSDFFARTLDRRLRAEGSAAARRSAHSRLSARSLRSVRPPRLPRPPRPPRLRSLPL
mmetsp:Transcript_16948/g.38768  ORF Transcript_16948/g.38768 Transcript_16948/m.38768 type:complete len:393 (-) Transcript_16948:184-1362(-)